MSARWQSPLFLSVWCAMFAAGPWASSASAQCNHGGSLNPRMSQGLIAQQMMQQQMLLQRQQQLLQQVQQQQLLQTAKLDRQMRELAKEGPEALKTALKDAKPEMRLIAVLTINKYGPALTDDLIERLTDDNATVRQAARRGLISLSTVRKGKPNKARSIDFGPAANANRTVQQSAARKWQTWFDKQQKKEESLKSVTAKTVSRSSTAP
jgi:hypothetical protein